MLKKGMIKYKNAEFCFWGL